MTTPSHCMGYSLTTNLSSLTKILPITDLETLLALWPEALADDEGVKECLPVVLRCLSDGMVAAVYTDNKFAGLIVTEEGDGIGLIHILPKTVGRECLNAVKAWAFEQGLNELRIIAKAINGSSFRFFEKTLGFRRNAVIFTMNLWQTQKS